MVIFTIKESTMKEKNLAIPTELRESNFVNEKYLCISNLKVLIFYKIKEKAILPPFLMISLTNKESMIK